MATVLFEGFFDQSLLKTAKNDRFRHNFFNILKTLGFFYLPPIFYLSNLDKQKFG